MLHDLALAAAFVAMVFSPCLISLFMPANRADAPDAVSATNATSR